MIRQPPVMSGARSPRLPFLGATHRYALIGAMLAALPAAADIGRTTAVVQQAQGTPPAQPTRVLIPRMNLFENERIQTDNRGVTQILFLDGTNLTVGPNSDLVIDRFIYDPDTSAGELATELGRGVLRFVGGQVSKLGAALRWSSTTRPGARTRSSCSAKTCWSAASGRLPKRGV